MGTSDPWRTVAGLADCTPVEAIARLAAAASTSRAGAALPRVSIVLASGGAVSGSVVAVSKGRNEPGTVVLASSDGPAGRAESVTFLRLDAVVAVTVHDAGAALPVLSGGELEDIPQGEPPSSLALKRRTAALATELGSLLGSTFSLDVPWDACATDAARYSLSLLLEDSVAALKALIAEHGPQEIAAGASGMRLVAAGSMEVSRSERTLVIGADLSRGRRGRLGREELVRRMASAL